MGRSCQKLAVMAGLFSQATACQSEGILSSLSTVILSVHVDSRLLGLHSVQLPLGSTCRCFFHIQSSPMPPCNLSLVIVLQEPPEAGKQI